MLRLAAALLAASALQACANNPLALIDGPFIPASERQAQAQAAQEPVAQPVVAPVEAPPVARPLAEQVPPEDLAYPDARFVGPMLTAGEMEQLAGEAAPVEPESVEPAVAVPETAEVPAEVGPGFLPPEPEAPRPTVATGSGEMVGPVAVPAERPVQLATRLPSAFDFAPAPTATPALPTNYTSFHSFAVAKLVNPPPRTGRQSMLLLDPPSLDPALVRCGTLPPAVLIDLDPAGSLVQVVSEDGTPSSPDLANYLADLRQRGVTVHWISGHGPDNASAIRRRLVASGLDPAGRDPLIVTRFAGESKQARRQALGETNCLLAIAGDQRGDFDELYDYVLDPAIAAPLEQHVGNGWFLTPPPLN